MDRPSVIIRNETRPGDLGYLLYLHGSLYAKEYGFDNTFETDVAIAVTDFFRSYSGQERIWIVEHRDEVAGCIAIVKRADDAAQLRWFLLHPKIRGFGIGRQLINEAISFSKKCGYSSMFLWTADILTEAAHLYKSAGFSITGEKTHTRWGQRLTEQRYDLKL
jgi:N-acetylglutamate synthase-like GNAT family acetyltransferase